MGKELSILAMTFSCALFGADPAVDRSANGWTVRNDRIAMELAHTGSGQIVLRSLRNIANGHEWAVAQTDAGVSLAAAAGAAVGDFRFNGDKIRKLPSGAVELSLQSVDARTNSELWLMVRCYPGTAALEFNARIENHGSKTMPLVQRIAPLTISVAGAAGLHAYSSDRTQKHGFSSLALRRLDSPRGWRRGHDDRRRHGWGNSSMGA
jgi:hypothetical protein